MTSKNYLTGERRYLRFCDPYQIPTSFLELEKVLSAFVAHLYLAAKKFHCTVNLVEEQLHCRTLGSVRFLGIRPYLQHHGTV